MEKQTQKQETVKLADCIRIVEVTKDSHLGGLIGEHIKGKKDVVVTKLKE